ncbi:hypothetical protein Pmani_026188 [Petrolisthes manimaculis]|uniref:Uncharacterized protein n=1 Tax=Petrolisthes manimaculis TaxID=1843537 RepID=A0AAE1U0C2_9EUCA|nr:hypothetical protein Pmani_026188 [Petrolisthes manimaculis]
MGLAGGDDKPRPLTQNPEYRGPSPSVTQCHLESEGGECIEQPLESFSLANPRQQQHNTTKQDNNNTTQHSKTTKQDNNTTQQNNNINNNNNNNTTQHKHHNTILRIAIE